MTTSAAGIDSAAEEAVAFSPPLGGTTRSPRARANSVTEAAPAALSRRAADLTESDETPPPAKVQERAQGAADDLAERLRTWLTSLAAGPSLLHVHPPTMAQHHQRARDCAAAHKTPAMAWACLAYRHLHWVLKFVLHAVEWCTDSFPKLLVTGFVAFVVYHWI